VDPPEKYADGRERIFFDLFDVNMMMFRNFASNASEKDASTSSFFFSFSSNWRRSNHVRELNVTGASKFFTKAQDMLIFGVTRPGGFLTWSYHMRGGKEQRG